jgi:hypothetical protein
MDYISAKDMSKKWGISPRRIAVLCKENRIDAIKIGNTWLIQKDTVKPADQRIKHNLQK